MSLVIIIPSNSGVVGSKTLVLSLVLIVGLQLGVYSVIRCCSGFVSGVQVPAAVAAAAAIDPVLFDRTIVLLTCVAAFWVHS